MRFKAHANNVRDSKCKNVVVVFVLSTQEEDIREQIDRNSGPF